MDVTELVDQHFRLAAAQDWDGLAAMYHRDARINRNTGERLDLESFLASLRAMTAAGITFSYENVRRVVDDHKVVEQHDVRMARSDGVEVVADVCVVAQFDDAGLIIHADEYLDPAAFAPLFAE